MSPLARARAAAPASRRRSRSAGRGRGIRDQAPWRCPRARPWATRRRRAGSVRRPDRASRRRCPRPSAPPVDPDRVTVDATRHGGPVRQRPRSSDARVRKLLARPEVLVPAAALDPARRPAAPPRPSPFARRPRRHRRRLAGSRSRATSRGRPGAGARPPSRERRTAPQRSTDARVLAEPAPADGVVRRTESGPAPTTIDAFRGLRVGGNVDDSVLEQEFGPAAPAPGRGQKQGQESAAPGDLNLEPPELRPYGSRLTSNSVWSSYCGTVRRRTPRPGRRPRRRARPDRRRGPGAREALQPNSSSAAFNASVTPSV